MFCGYSPVYLQPTFLNSPEVVQNDSHSGVQHLYGTMLGTQLLCHWAWEDKQDKVAHMTLTATLGLLSRAQVYKQTGMFLYKKTTSKPALLYFLVLTFFKKATILSFIYMTRESPTSGCL